MALDQQECQEFLRALGLRPPKQVLPAHRRAVHDLLLLEAALSNQLPAHSLSEEGPFCHQLMVAAADYLENGGWKRATQNGHSSLTYARWTCLAQFVREHPSEQRLAQLTAYAVARRLNLKPPATPEGAALVDELFIT